MTERTTAGVEEPGGATTAPRGTEHAVDIAPVAGNVQSAALLLAGPVILTVHFFVVYLAAEAGCTGDGPLMDLFDPPVPKVLTLVATAIAAVMCAATAWIAWIRIKRATPHSEPMLLIGFMLSVLGFLTVLFVGLPAAFLESCS